jgi:hypothetical protein
MDAALLAPLSGIAQLVVLGTLAALIYKLGVWRQKLDATTEGVLAEVRAHREESSATFGGIERRLDAVDHLLALLAERVVRLARWQARTDRRLDRLDRADPSLAGGTVI